MLHSINATNELLAKPSNYYAQRFSTEIQDRLLVSYLSQIFQRPGRLVAPKSYQMPIKPNKQLRRRRESKSEEYGPHNPDWLQRADMSLKFSVPSLAYPQFSQ